MNKKSHVNTLDFANHPCFNDKVRHKSARIHLPVAPKCNIQCNFCDKQYACANENRPGVSSVILSPHQALAYLDKAMDERKDISVAGIAGPGDPFANADETLETLRLVRKVYPDLLLCVATNGLNLFPYLDALARIKVSHISITINAVDAGVGEKIYAWARDGAKIYRGREAAEVLLCRQLEALVAIKKYNIIAKVNSIIIPGINDAYIGDIAKKVSSTGADIMNPIPIYPVVGTVFENIVPPDADAVAMCRREADKFISVMNHCSRCRADAVGLLGDNPGAKEISLLQSCAALPLVPQEDRPYIACASREGFLVNMHLGQAEKFYVFGPSATFRTDAERSRSIGKGANAYKLIAVRNAPEPGDGDKRWAKLSSILKDCSAVLAEAAGQAPREALAKNGIKVFVTSGLIAVALEAVSKGEFAETFPGNCDCTKNGMNWPPSPGCGCAKVPPKGGGISLNKGDCAQGGGCG